MGWRGFEPGEVLRILTEFSDEASGSTSPSRALPDWTVVYLDELALHRALKAARRGRFGPARSAREYEVVPEPRR